METTRHEGFGLNRVVNIDQAAALPGTVAEEALVAAYRAAEQEIGKLETELRLQLQQVLKRYNPQWASPEAAFRKSEVFNHDPKAVATWLRLGERVGRALVWLPYDKEKFREALAQIRALTVERPEVFVPRMKGLCSAAGVAVVEVDRPNRLVRRRQS